MHNHDSSVGINLERATREELVDHVLVQRKLIRRLYQQLAAVQSQSFQHHGFREPTSSTGLATPLPQQASTLQHNGTDFSPLPLQPAVVAPTPSQGADVSMDGPGSLYHRIQREICRIDEAIEAQEAPRDGQGESIPPHVLVELRRVRQQLLQRLQQETPPPPTQRQPAQDNMDVEESHGQHQLPLDFCGSAEMGFRHPLPFDASPPPAAAAVQNTDQQLSHAASSRSLNLALAPGAIGSRDPVLWWDEGNTTPVTNRRTELSSPQSAKHHAANYPTLMTQHASSSSALGGPGPTPPSSLVARLQAKVGLPASPVRSPATYSSNSTRATGGAVYRAESIVGGRLDATSAPNSRHSDMIHDSTKSRLQRYRSRERATK